MLTLAARLITPWASHVPMALAAAVDTSTSINGGLIAQAVQFGFLGAVFIDLVATHKFFVTRWTSDREMKLVREGYEARIALLVETGVALRVDLVETKAALTQTLSVMQEKVIPTMVQMTEVSRAFVSELAHRGGGGRADGS